MRTLLLSTALLALAPPHHGGHHGNPEDLEAYVAAMEEPGRAAWQKPDEVVRTLALKPGQTVCDVGAGPGYFSLPIARALGAGGRVYAVDVEARILEALVHRLRGAGVRNVTPVLALPDDPLLPAATCDVALVVDTYHHFPDGEAYLRTLRTALKPGGRLVNIDFHKKPLPLGPPPERKVSREDFLARASAAGFALDTEHAFLPYQYFLVLKAR